LPSLALSKGAKGLLEPKNEVTPTLQNTGKHGVALQNTGKHGVAPRNTRIFVILNFVRLKSSRCATEYKTQRK